MAGAVTTAPVIVGEVLFDRFPDGTAVLGGAPFNVAWHLAAFSAAPAVVTRVGNDEAGRAVREAMDDWGMDTRWLQVDPDRPTGTVEVRMKGGSHRFEILGDQAYDRIEPRDLPGDPALVYHGTLALRSPGPRRAVEALRAAGAPVFVDVNLRAPWWDEASVGGLLEEATWAKLNEDELETLAGRGDRGEARRFRERFDLELLIVTRGSEGSLVVSADGRELEAAPEPGVEVVDTVGAGDAFTAVVLLGLLRGWPLEEIQPRAQRFASALVGIRGGTCRDRSFYDPFLDAWRED